MNITLDNIPGEWVKDGLCGQTDPEAFFAEKGGRDDVAYAKATCRKCDVREQCLTWALENDERYGVWGGLTERERRKLKKKPGAKVGRPRTSTCGTNAGWALHRERAEQPCDPCREARNTYQREHRERRRQNLSEQKLTALELAQAGRREVAQREHDERLTDLRHLVATGANIDEVLTRLNVRRDTLWRWCKRNGHTDLWAALNPVVEDVLPRPNRRKRRAVA